MTPADKKNEEDNVQAQDSSETSENVSKLLNLPKKSLSQRWIGNITISALLAAIGLFASFILAFFNLKDVANFDEGRQTAVIQHQLETLTAILKTITKNKTTLYDTNIQKHTIDQSTKDDLKLLKSDIATLNNIILDNPEKAISVVLLKKELTELKEKTGEYYKSEQNEISRIYDLFKWIAGLFFALIVSLISLAFSNVYFRKKESMDGSLQKEIEALKIFVAELKAKH